MPVGLKVCGITRAEDMQACVALGVDAVGLNLWPGSKRVVSLADARTLVEALAPARAPQRVGVFVDAALDEVGRACVELRLDAIQPHGDAPNEPYARLAAELDVAWVWVIRGTPSLDALAIPELAPAWVLLDAAAPGFGGAGRPTDWAWAARAVERLAPLPVWLAGGVTPDNAAEAIARVRPAGLDVASGVETAPGIKSREAIARLRAICDASRDA